MSIPFLSDVKVRSLSPVELFATKINALIGRSAARDIYDVYNMVKHQLFVSDEEKTSLRKATVFYLTFSAALKDLNAKQDKYVINFVYDELEDFKVTKNIKNESVPDAIMNLIGFYPIKMKQVDNIIIVECIQKTSNRMMGRIVDTHHRPVDFANVALLNVSDSSLITGGVTNENGQFVILHLLVEFGIFTYQYQSLKKHTFYCVSNKLLYFCKRKELFDKQTYAHCRN